MSIAIVYSAIITYETIIQYDNFTLERFSANSLVSSREQLINTGKQVISEFNLTEVLLGKGISGGRFAVASIYDPEEKVKNKIHSVCKRNTKYKVIQLEPYILPMHCRLRNIQSIRIQIYHCMKESRFV